MMAAVTWQQVLALSIDPIVGGCRRRYLRRVCSVAQRHIEVAQAKIADEQNVVRYYQQVEMHARCALRELENK